MQFTKVIGADEGTVKARNSFLKFLREIDDCLQELTLGINQEKREKPLLTNHRYRELDDYARYEGSATGQFLWREEIQPKGAEGVMT